MSRDKNNSTRDPIKTRTKIIRNKVEEKTEKKMWPKNIIIIKNFNIGVSR